MPQIQSVFHQEKYSFYDTQKFIGSCLVVILWLLFTFLQKNDLKKTQCDFLKTEQRTKVRLSASGFDQREKERDKERNRQTDR